MKGDKNEGHNLSILSPIMPNLKLAPGIMSISVKILFTDLCLMIPLTGSTGEHVSVHHACTGQLQWGGALRGPCCHLKPGILKCSLKETPPPSCSPLKQASHNLDLIFSSRWWILSLSTCNARFKTDLRSKVSKYFCHSLEDLL